MSDLATSSRPRVVTWPFVIVTAVTLVFFTSIGVTLVTVPLFVERELGAGEFGIGLTIASFAAAAIAARPLITRLGNRYGRRRLMMGGAVLAAAGSSVAGWHRRCRYCSSSGGSRASARRRCSSVRSR